jgi:hypothetical protein
MWGNIVIFAVAIVAGYQYYIQTPDFLANPNPTATFASGWNGVNKSSSLIFLMLIVMYTLLPLFIYRGDPWKQPLYKNGILTFLIVMNSIMFFTIYYTTSYLSILDLVPIGTK